MKKVKFGLIICLVFVLAVFMGCSKNNDNNTGEISSVMSKTETPKEAVTPISYPELDLNPQEALSVNEDGIKAVSQSELVLSDEDIQKLKDGNYSAAFCYHTQSDTCNQTKLASATALLNSWGIEVVSVTDANFDAATQTAQIESTMALNPDILFVMPYDADACASALKASVVGTDTQIVFMENTATGFTAGVDYIGCASSDSYGNGKACADILAKEIGYKGEVAMMFYDMVYPVTNERDRGFIETIENNYPEIEIVMKAGFTNPNDTGTVADAILARFPNIDGIYATWDIPAEGAIAAANSLGREDLIITCCDLGDTAAKSIAEDGMIRGSGAPRSPEQGQAEALLAAYGLLGKELPSTYVTPPALPVIKSNVLEAYKISYGIDAPQWLQDILN